MTNIYYYVLLRIITLNTLYVSESTSQLCGVLHVMLKKHPIVRKKARSLNINKNLLDRAKRPDIYMCIHGGVCELEYKK